MAGFTAGAISDSISSPGKLEKFESRDSVSSSNDAASRDPWIFREGRRTISGAAILRGISSQLQRGSLGWVDALIQAGEFEAALADAAHPSATFSADLTDALALAVSTGNSAHADRAGQMVERLQPPEWVSISPPEGFTYYALHPLDFARVISHFAKEPRTCAVIGIRSIGATLSAVTTAALRNDGHPTSRVTVRPSGHPYSRRTDFDHAHLQWIREQAAKGSQFVVVDEGPGRSGSTFLSVAEALLGAGIQRDRITIVGSRQPDPESLCAENAASRWSEFRYIATSPSVNARFKDCLYAGGGCWREVFLAEERKWPESWTQTERLKFISPDQQMLYKFEGMGRVGAEARERAFALSQAGFGPHVADAGDGFLAYDLLEGRHLRAADINPSLLDQMARYCAFRASNFTDDRCGASQLKEMVEFNIQQEFGTNIVFDDDELSSSQPVLVDGRMQSYEWIATSAETFVKTDAIDHGDNHFFPGPCDIAWDLAGISVEWALDGASTEHLVREFQRHSGDDARRRLSGYLLAYSTFRTGFCRMALESVRGSTEEPRLRSAYIRYRQEALRHIRLRLRNL